MLNKTYDKVSQFIKDNYKQIILLILFYIFMTFPVPYYILTSGGTIDVDNRIEIENASNSSGSFNLAYVSELRGTIPIYLLSYIIPDWERVKVDTYKYNENETIEDINIRDKYYLENANQAAIYTAYTNANKDFTINDKKFIIYFIHEKASNKIRVGDELISVDGHSASNIDEYKELVSKKEIGDNVTLLLKRGSKEIEVKTKVFEEEGIKLSGLAFFEIYDYEVTPEIELKFKSSESGPSGGLTTSLAIYNKLVKEDITKGKKIVGTGTIDFSGNVGEIGGVKYKLIGAVKDKADIFIVPNGANYEECVKLKKEKKYKIEIVGVDNFKDAIEKLDNIK